MRSLLFKVFLWFWLTLMVVALGMAVVLTHYYGGTPRTFRVGRTWVMYQNLHTLLVMFLAGAVFCYLITRHVTSPIFKLRVAAKRIADGRLDTRVGPSLLRRRDELAALGHDFDRMAERIEALVTGQRRLLGDASHELRSPLARLIVALELLKQRPGEDTAEHLERIGLEAQRLDKLIGQLLTLSRIDSGAAAGPPSSFDLTNLVQEVASDGDFEARASQKRVEVTVASACTVTGSEELLRSAVENVIRNAVRHTREGTAVEVSLERQGQMAVLRVRDHGAGVPEDMLPEIFLPFRRAGANGEGAGLGLAITERAVILHGGTVRAANAPDGGLMVEIVVPTALQNPLAFG